MKKLFQSVVVILGVLFLFTGNAFALGGLDKTAGQAGFSENNILNIIGNSVNLVLSLVGVIFAVMMIAGGFLWMTAHGNEKQASAARNLLIAGVIGFIIVVSAYAISAFIGSSLDFSSTGGLEVDDTATTTQ